MSVTGNPATGAQTALFYIEEAVCNVTPTTPQWKPLRYTGGIPQLNREVLQSNELDGSREINDVRNGSQNAAGDINVELSHLSHVDLIAAALQSTFEVDPDDSDVMLASVGRNVRTFSLLIQYNDLLAQPAYDIVTGVEFTGFSITLGVNAIATASFSVIGRGYDANATLPAGSTFADRTTSQPYTGLDGVITLDGSALGIVTSMSPTLDNNANAVFAIGSRGVSYVEYGRANNTFDLATAFSSYDLFTRFIDEQRSAITLRLTLDGNFLEFMYPKVHLTQGSPNPEGEGTIALTVSVQALRDATVGSSVVISYNV